MDYQLFARLYHEAENYTDVDMYVGERGWQDWMDGYSEEKVGSMLCSIYEIARMDFKALRTKLQLSQVQMGIVYDIPRRTIENWESGNALKDREPPRYLVCLVAYTVFERGILSVDAAKQN